MQPDHCLFLNIWAPVDSSGKKLPVIVYIYGGGYHGGSSSAPFMSGEFLAEKGVVYVNFNYRLSVPGNLGLPELTAESPHKASGNYVHLDEGSRDLTNVKTLDEYMAVVKRVAGKKAGEMLNLYTASTDEEAR